MDHKGSKEPNSSDSRPSISEGEGNSKTKHSIQNLAIPDHVQILAKEFDDMKVGLGQLTKELIAFKSKKGKEPKEGYSHSHYFPSDRYGNTLGGSEEGAPSNDITQGRNGQRQT